MTERFVLAVDQGTTSTRCILFDHDGRMVVGAQREHKQHFPKPGWVEHDAVEIWRNLERIAPEALAQAGITARPGGGAGHRQPAGDHRRVGPAYRATRSAAPSSGRTPAPTRWSTRCRARPDARTVHERCGLPLATYFSAPRIRWLLDHVPGLRERAESGDVLFGTMESWLIWNLTGGPDGGVHVTDATNASRTLLMNLATLDGTRRCSRSSACRAGCCREIRPSIETYGTAPAACCPACRSPPRSATSRPPCSARPASPPARPNARTEPAASCC